MTIPTLTPAPLVVPNKFGGDPVAFSVAMQAWIAWENTRAAQDPAFLAWIDAKATAVDTGAAAVAEQSPVSNAAAAAASAAAALTRLNDFKGRYYGPLSANPTLDPLGEGCSAGDAYFNTVNHVMMVFNSLGRWQNYEAAAAGLAAAASNSAAQAAAAQVSAVQASAVAVDSAAAAVDSAATASVSAQAAAATANLYASTALGLAGTAYDGYFSVPAADDLFVGLYRNDAGVATLIDSVYSTQKIDAMEWMQAANCLDQAAALVRTQASVLVAVALS